MTFKNRAVKWIDGTRKTGELPSIAIGLLASIAFVVTIARFLNLVPIEFMIGLGTLAFGISVLAIFAYRLWMDDAKASLGKYYYTILINFVFFMFLSRPTDLSDVLNFTYLFILGVAFFIVGVVLYLIVEEVTEEYADGSFRERAFLSWFFTSVGLFSLILLMRMFGMFNLFELLT